MLSLKIEVSLVTANVGSLAECYKDSMESARSLREDIIVYRGRKRDRGVSNEAVFIPI